MRNFCSITERAGRRWRLVPEWGAWAEMGLFLRILAFGLHVRWLRRLKWSRLQGLLERRLRRPSMVGAGSFGEGDVLRCLENALNFGRPWVQGDCLARGLIRYYFLRRAEVPVTLCFGIPRGGEGLAGPGHCWLERDGKPFLEGSDPRTAFLPIYHLPFQQADDTHDRRVPTVGTGGGA